MADGADATGAPGASAGGEEGFVTGLLDTFCIFGAGLALRGIFSIFNYFFLIH
jgi:hypothetical protein